ncbi:MAG: DUF1015 domain-containing protein [Acutalibacteraceae bacterium]|jgi:uncharacterized protein (DUF1015 family)
MADLHPFRAWRFTEKAGAIDELTCPPYDIISETQRQAYLARNEHNIIRLELPRDGADPYAAAGETLRRWMDGDVLRRDETAAFYVYDITFTVDGVTRTVGGFMARTRLEEFSRGIVLPHEFTLSKAKEDRFRLMQATNCNFSHIYALYREDSGAVEARLNAARQTPPLAELTDEAGLTHRLWAITDPAAIEEIRRCLADTKLYIADGHHRYETALRYRDERRAAGAPVGSGADFVMMMLVEMSHPGLVVFPTHRLIRDLDGFDPSAVLAACEEFFTVEHIPLPAAEKRLAAGYDAGQKVFAFYTGGDTAALLTLRDAAVMDAVLPDRSPVSRQLDVNVLHTLILERLMGIDKENMANQKNLTYTRSAAEAVDGVQSGRFQACFLINPTRVEEIRDVAAAGEKMPQKSTYFYPKLITGLTVNELD